MEKVRLGKTDLMVSKVAFGGIPIQRVSVDEAVEVVNKCISLGINFIDTANAYTNSEERIGKAIKDKREELIIATKSLERDRAGVEKHLKLSLERLGTDYIDLFQFHNVPNDDELKALLKDGGPMSLVLDAKKRGVIRHIGVTAHSLGMAKKLVECGHFETIMFPLNFITYEAASELVPLAEKHDVGFIAMKPLEGGRLEENVSLAFKYLLQFPSVVTVVGIEKPPEIEEIVGLMSQPLTITKAEEDKIYRMREELGQKFCRRCDYCQPCPQEIPISFVMDFPSLCRRLPLDRVYLTFVSEAMDKVAECTECGECESRCPYDLPIREIISGYLEDYKTGREKFMETYSCDK